MAKKMASKGTITSAIADIPVQKMRAHRRKTDERYAATAALRLAPLAPVDLHCSWTGDHSGKALK
jgi:hypothetical protein